MAYMDPMGIICHDDLHLFSETLEIGRDAIGRAAAAPRLRRLMPRCGRTAAEADGFPWLHGISHSKNMGTLCLFRQNPHGFEFIIILKHD